MENEIIIKEIKQSNKESIVIIASIIFIIIQYTIPLNPIMSFILLTLNLAFIGIIGEYLVDSATKLSLKLEIKLFIIGLVLIPFFSSLPEDIITIVANLEEPELGEIMLAQILGNALFELLMIFGIVGFLICKKGKCMEVEDKERFLFIRNGLILLVGSILVFLLIFLDKSLSFMDSIILIVFYGCFVFIVVLSNRLGIEDKMEMPEEYNMEDISGKKEFIKLIIYVLIVGILGSFFVDNILFFMDLSDHFKKFSFIYIGILVAVPELILSIIGVYKGKEQLIIGSVIGGTIWDITISISIQGLINPIEKLSTIIVSYFLFVSIVGVIVSLIYIRTHWKLKQWEVIFLIVLYLVIVVGIMVVI